MLLRLRKNKSAADLEALRALVDELGYRTRFLDVDERFLELTRVPSALPSAAATHRSRLEDLTCVEAVLDHPEAPELFQRTSERPASTVRAAEAAFGGGHAALIAGPCAVEDSVALLTVARAVHAAGATLLRGGAFKPRTSPYSFQGLGRRGLERLERVKSEVGIGIVTEVLDPREVERVAGVADMLQIGSRSMTNAALIAEAGRSGRPVLLKRGLAATAREFLLAAEYVLATGNEAVVLCERGIRGFDDVTRNVLDVGTVAYLKGATHLPVIVDPSHAAGRADLVPALAKAGIAAGADGLIVEVHADPSHVHSDGAQAIAPAVFAEIAETAEALLSMEGKILSRPRPSDAEPPLAALERAP